MLQTQDADYHLFKKDRLTGQLTYATDKNLAANLETISASRAHDIIVMNQHGEKPLSLMDNGKVKEPKKPIDLLEGADISRFDKAKRRKKNKPKPKAQGQKADKQERRPNANRNKQRRQPTDKTKGQGNAQ